ncbi:MAG: hypothetical protein APR55_01480 [Methanolinea sp. SDB]|nr:MAG: hypothetical protein APR55_01480 [Methanolinea sp. SDB]
MGKFAWYGVLVLLVLLPPVKGITLGPKLPAFISPTVLDVFVKSSTSSPTLGCRPIVSACSGPEIPMIFYRKKMKSSRR